MARLIYALRLWCDYRPTRKTRDSPGKETRSLINWCASSCPERQRILRPPWPGSAPDCGQEAVTDAHKAIRQAYGGNRRKPKQTGGALCIKVNSPSRGRDRKVHRRSLNYLQGSVALLSYA